MPRANPASFIDHDDDTGGKRTRFGVIRTLAVTAADGGDDNSNVAVLTLLIARGVLKLLPFTLSVFVRMLLPPERHQDKLHVTSCVPGPNGAAAGITLHDEQLATSSSGVVGLQVM